MTAFNFQKRFAPLIIARQKNQTIRALRKDGKPHCRVGDKIKLYTGMRTKDCRLIGSATVTKIVDITIDDFEDVYLHVPGALLDHQEREVLAREDGFADYHAMENWFHQTHGLPFDGVLIKWAGFEIA